MDEIRIELRGFGTSSGTADDVVGDLDVTSNEDFPLSLTFQNFDVRDFSTRNGAFSKTFSIPATSNNNSVLRNLWHSGWVRGSANSTGNIPCTIYASNIPITSGKLRVTKVVKDTDVKSYDCTFLGDNMDWASGIKDLDLKDLKFSSEPYDTYYSTSGDSLENGGIQAQPFVFSNIQGDDDLVDAVDAQHYQKNHDRLVYPLLSIGEGVSDRKHATDLEFIPCVYIKNVWDKIFQAQGYEVESTFCDSEYFRSLIMPLFFRRQGGMIDGGYGEIRETRTNEDLTGAYFYNDSSNASTIAAHLNTTQANAIGNVAVNMRIGNLSTDALTDLGISTDLNNLQRPRARYAFTGDFIDDTSSQEGVPTQVGNVVYGQSIRHTVLRKLTSSPATITFKPRVRHFRLEDDFGGTFKYKLVAEIWKVPSVGGLPQDDNSNIYKVMAEATSGDATNSNFVSNTNYEGFRRVRYADIAIEKNGSAEYNGQYNDSIVGDEGVWDDLWSPTLEFTDNGTATANYIGVISAVVTDYPDGFIGDIIGTDFGIGGDGGSVEIQYQAGSQFTISGEEEFRIGDDMSDIQFMLPKGKQSDFVMGLAQMFNLQFHTDPIAKKVFVEPYDYFYNKTNNALDWSEKIDYSKNITEEFLHEIKSKLVFKYKDADNDALLSQYNKKHNVDWGAYEEVDEDGLFQKGEYLVENKFFSPSFNYKCAEYTDVVNSIQIPSYDSWCTFPIYLDEYAAVGVQRDVDFPEKNFDIGARILCLVPAEVGYEAFAANDEYINLGGDTNRRMYRSHLTGTGQVYSQATNNDLDAASTLVGEFARGNFFHLDRKNGNKGTGVDLGLVTLGIGHKDASGVEIELDPNLSYNRVKHVEISEVDNNYTITQNGLYFYFHSKMVNQLKNNPRLKVVYLNLDYQDILTLDFRDLIYLDGVYYRINRISDFKPHKNESTKVELIEYFELGTQTSFGEVMDLRTNGLQI
tara:strand:- start:9640 stop:12552 length:2913 start_codon:yes stop_codon:yes gene_type:complete